MKLKKIANSLRMNVTDFAKLAGYSRQELYLVVGRRKKPCKDKFGEALSSIKSYSDEMYENDIERAVAEKELREKLISEFAEKGI